MAVAKRKIKPAKQTKPKRELTVIEKRPQTLVEVCYAASRDKSVDVAKMRALAQLATEQQWSVAMLAAQREISEHRIIKAAYNTHTRSHYVKLEDLAGIVDPIAHKHGFTLIFGMAEGAPAGHYRITLDVRHESGHIVHKWADIGMDVEGPKGGGTKSGAQGSGSSISYGRRYLTCMVFNIVPVGEDNDGVNVNATISDKQLKVLKDLMGEIDTLNKLDAGTTETQLCEWLAVDNVKELTQAQLAKAMVGLEQKRATKAA